MHRFRALLLLLLVAILIVPVPAIAQSSIPLLDPGWHIVPNPQELDSTCPEDAPLGIGGVLVLMQNLMNAAVALTVIVLILVIAYAGFLLVTSPFSSENRSKAKSTLLNAVIGMALVLASWLIVDFVMKLIYEPESTFAGEALGPWNQILVGGDACIRGRDGNPLFEIPFTRAPRPDTSVGLDRPGGTAGPGQPASLGAGACSPGTIATAAANGGYALTAAQVQTLSCLAKAESSCGQNISGARSASGRTSTAHGMFQVVMGYDDKCHNLNIPVCSEAAKRAGWKGSGNLNCSRAFSGGKVRPGMEELARVCRAASTNLDCNASAAACLVKENPNFSDWTGTGDGHSHAAQKACVRQFNI
ncbi:MAG TPA: pilin [Candidatus Paceibacterota bacterium]|nr:pilin [Candidatus Paceibacterota bacterium]